MRQIYQLFCVIQTLFNKIRNIQLCNLIFNDITNIYQVLFGCHFLNLCVFQITHKNLLKIQYHEV